MRSGSKFRKLIAHDPVQADIRLGRANSESPMQFRRNPHLESPRIFAVGNGRGRRLASRLHLRDDVGHQSADAVQRTGLTNVQMGQARELGAKANELAVFGRPDHAIGIQGIFFYLFLSMDVYSHKIVGWEVYPQESAAHAASVLHKAYLREGVHPCTLVVHSDKGSPTKGATMLAMLQRLGVVPSFSRPAVSNDNPYSESLFNTVMGRPDCPSDPFYGVEAARRGCRR
jgi:transposase InsO family protein